VADLMVTSGFYQTTARFFITDECCDYTGWVVVTEDTEDMTVSWDCPECGHHEEGDMGRDD
jgi:predicted RNA-binding Zn-ribbon protein involved in translation (DUF1610 family)